MDLVFARVLLVCATQRCQLSSSLPSSTSRHVTGLACSHAARAALQSLPPPPPRRVAERGSSPPPKKQQIANRIKAKGLQKLRWYCQLCQKQCRDENGFKCHQTSESHIRQMELFGQNADGVIDEFSQEFETTFVEHLARA